MKTSSEIVYRIGASDVRLDLAAYPDGMPLVRFVPSEPVRALLLRPSSLSTFMAAMFWVDALRDRGLATPKLVLPFIPGARQDRLNATGDFLLTAKSIARELNAREFPSVTVLDPHSDVAAGLIERCVVVPAVDCVAIPRGKYAAVISPDAGAEKRAGAIARHCGIPLVHAWKTRDVSDGKITGFGMQPTDHQPGSLVLVVDDICDGGGTFIGIADVLDGRGLKAHLWTTHGIYSQGTAKLLERFGHIYCTDSIVGAPRDGVIEIQASQQLLALT